MSKLVIALALAPLFHSAGLPCSASQVRFGHALFFPPRLSSGAPRCCSHRGWYDVSSFPGRDASVKINACKAALDAAGGGTCDARSLEGLTQTESEEIDWGTVRSQYQEILLLPLSGFWSWAFSDGRSCGIKQFSNSSILSGATGGAWSGLQLGAASSSTRMDSLYCTDPSAARGISNVKAQGFYADNSQHGTFVNGLLHISNVSDQSSFIDMGAINLYGNAWVIGKLCCGVSFNRIFGQTGQSSSDVQGGDALLVKGGGNAVLIENSTFNGPGTGANNIRIDPSTDIYAMVFLNDYGEKYTTDDGGTPMIFIGPHVANVQFIGGFFVNGCTRRCSQYLFENHTRHGFSVKNVGFGWFDTNGINDLARGATWSSDGYTIHGYSTGNDEISRSFDQEISTSILSGTSPAPELKFRVGAGSLDPGSTNLVGVIAAATSGRLSFQLTWSEGGVKKPYPHRAVCHFVDETSHSDHVTTTSADSSRLSASGTSKAGDLISYICVGF